MSYTRVSLRRIGCAAFASAQVVALAASVQAQTRPAMPPTAEQMYKNIQALKGTPGAELILSMHFIRASLGVTCEYCHDERDRSSDVKPAKQTARQMINMMFGVNKSLFQGRQVVTCYTCHRGNAKPVDLPPYPLPEPKPEPSLAVALPSADQILANYVRALGGEEAIRKVTTRVVTATQFIPTGPGGQIPVPAQTEQYQKAPNFVLNIYRTPTYTISEGFDGTTRWAQDANGRVIDAPKIDQDRARRTSIFFDGLDLKQRYSKLTVAGIERVQDRDAYLVVADVPDDTPDRLYFDRDTGLLLRKTTDWPTPLGAIRFEVNYEDYRDAGHGVKVPFLVKMIPATPRMEQGVVATVRVQKVEENVPIDDAKFRKPESKPAPPR
jgi:photosynthetic reaction center cytochrome c subunit